MERPQLSYDTKFSSLVVNQCMLANRRSVFYLEYLTSKNFSELPDVNPMLPLFFLFLQVPNTLFSSSSFHPCFVARLCSLLAMFDIVVWLLYIGPAKGTLTDLLAAHSTPLSPH